MRIIDVNDFNDKYMMYIGKGYNANCYKLDKDTVVKIFNNDYKKRYLLDKSKYMDKLASLYTVNNDSIISPLDLIISDSQIIGYTHKYINGKNIDKVCNNIFLKNSTKISDLFDKNYQALLNDLYEASNKGFSFTDIKANDIIIDSNNNYHIVDLDNSIFTDEYSKKIIFSANARLILKRIIESIFSENIMFENKDINLLYRNIDPISLNSISNFIDALSCECNSYIPSIGEVKRKVKVKKLNEIDYLKRV